MITKTTTRIVMTATLIAGGFAAQSLRAQQAREVAPVEVAEAELTYADMLAVPVTFDQVMRTALENAEGRLVEISLDDLHDTPVFVAVVASPTSLTEIVVSATDGSILNTATQTAASPEMMQQLLDDEFEDGLDFASLIDELEDDECDCDDDDDEDDDHKG
ncbi:hypothetical protein [Phaeobacter sp. JH18-37]|uniref:hypothetical protein n=1 Tax=Phaeobacter sp. JH18-37 TaxID=3112458 RepID=UPI003A844CF3